MIVDLQLSALAQRRLKKGTLALEIGPPPLDHSLISYREAFAMASLKSITRVMVNEQAPVRKTRNILH